MIILSFDGECDYVEDRPCVEMEACRERVAARNDPCVHAETGVDDTGNVHCWIVHDELCEDERDTDKRREECRREVTALNDPCTVAETGVDENGDVYCRAITSQQCVFERGVIARIDNIERNVVARIEYLAARIAAYFDEPSGDARREPVL